VHKDSFKPRKEIKIKNRFFQVKKKEKIIIFAKLVEIIYHKSWHVE